MFTEKDSVRGGALLNATRGVTEEKRKVGLESRAIEGKMRRICREKNKAMVKRNGPARREIY